MSALATTDLISVADYLAGELESPIKHEYLGGVVYAMAGAKNRHNIVATNCLVALGSQLRGKPCRALNSDTKVRVRSRLQTRFYYPDASVVCLSDPADQSYQDLPVVLAEVISESTRRTDEVEKLDAYLTIPSLEVYLLIEPEQPRVVVHRRGDQGFVREVVKGVDAVIPLPDVGAELALRDLYEGAEAA